jgi:signal transduction histidine kinase/ligand-binding sensor domain-containing protein/DNA-binding response OmpR family regulator
MNRFLPYILLFLLLLPSFGFTQNIRFKHLSVNDGLSQNAVFAITQDKKGFMWFGTRDGLNRYDGYTIKQYHHDPNDQNSLDDNHITAMHTDATGNLWVGTFRGNLNRYDASTDTFERIPLPQQDYVAANESEILSIISDPGGNLWIGTFNNGLFKVPVKNDVLEVSKTVHYKGSEGDRNGLADNNVMAIYAEDEQNIWLGTENGLHRLHKESGRFTQFQIDVKSPVTPETVGDFAVLSIIKGEKQKLWLGTNSGLVLFDTKTLTYEFFPHRYTVFRYGWGAITGIVKDKKGNLWLKTAAELMQFDTRSKTYIPHKHDPFNPQSLIFNNISSIFIDNTEQLWVGTNGMGISIYDPKSHRFSLIDRKKESNSRIAGFSVRSIYKEADRYLWIGSDVIYRLDLKTKDLKSFEKSSDSLKAFGNTGAWSIIRGSDNLMWFATTEGLYSYDSGKETYRYYTHDPLNPDGLLQKNVAMVFEDSRKDIWVMAINHLSKLTDKKAGKFVHYRYNSSPESNRAVRLVFHEISPGNFLIGTQTGLLFFNEKTGVFTRMRNEPGNPESLINNEIKCISKDPEDPENFLWIGTSGGLSKFNIKEKTFETFTIRDGLPNNVIYAVLPDHLNNLWISTNNGLSKFNPGDKTFRNFDVQDGLQSNEFNTGAYFKSPEGELFFGGIKGITHFFPEMIKENPYLPKTAITSIIVSQKSDEENPFFVQNINPYTDHKIEFSHRDKVITFEFASLDFSATQKNNYAYKLEGFNDNWIQNNTLNTATFTNLPPGNYTLRVKSSNNDGIWNEQGASLSFKVHPHWSGTWWAYSVYFLMLLLILYFIRKYELKRFQINNQLKFERLESETLRELDDLKSRFFTNISHEFRTPLTIINGQTEQLLKDIKNRETNKKLQQVQQNSNRLLELINQLLDVAKLESGKMQLYTSTIEVVSFFKNLFFSFETLANEKSISLKFSSSEKEIYIASDPEHLQKIITNILSNAIKFTPEGGNIAFFLHQKNEEQIVMDISDTGIGIAEKDIEHIFNRFYQADHTDSRAYEGTGIGLALAKELAEIVSGELSVKNNSINPGATFSLELPIGKPDKNLIELRNQPIKQPLKNGNLNGSSKKVYPENGKLILVVEDNKQVRGFITDQFKENYVLIEADNGQHGFELAQKHIPDLILTDVMMPVLDGYAMVKQLKNDEKTSHIPVIMLTGKVTQEDKIKGLETGVDAYLAKPFHIDELHLIISNLLQKQEQLKKKFGEQSFSGTDSNEIPSIDRTFLEKVNTSLQKNYTRPDFTVEALAELLCMSTSQLHRKLKALTGATPGDWIRKFRLNKASELLKNNAAGVAEICYRVGFNDHAYFSRAFKNEFGCSPSAFKKEMA